ncbi:hypothetical protein LIPSTDRAFT_69539 [Lipomyces starkeyi NRRL Y-11557]|uniref:BED-type domain-containing protein n=1 Tax=Lipomyces starkeyi NRRL Y-11557 TaxID=675824 RepID=A0A1E3Q8M3_LIPST|nr:hypothetical protein LIPSTDRAFT_69539 [Lipomyces starkeyi NRRL Y-11557]
MDFPTRPRRKQAVDYLLLNDGYEGDQPMLNILPEMAQSSIESSVDLAPEDYSQIASQSFSTGLTEELTCKHCQKWSIKDSCRSTSTTNMSYHLQKSHGLPLGNDKEDATQPTIMTIYSWRGFAIYLTQDIETKNRL